MGTRWMGPTTTIIITLLLFLKATVSKPSASQFGQCQAKCLSEFSNRRDRRLLNGETILNEIDVANVSDFSLCKLGCTMPGWSELTLPAFMLGQDTFQNLQSQKADEVTPQTVVSRVRVLCVDTNPANDSYTFKLELHMDDGAHENYVHYIDVFARIGTSRKELSVSNTYAYSPSVEITFREPKDLASLQFRVTTFTTRGIMGNTVKTAWITKGVIDNSPKTSVTAAIQKQLWIDEQAAVELRFSVPHGELPACSQTLSYDASIDEAKIPFTMDRSMGFLLEGLMFDHEYHARIVSTVLGEQRATTGSTDFGVENVIRTQSCRNLAQDSSMCAPPPVESVSWEWSGDEAILLNWTYGGESNELPASHFPRMVHFVVTIRPLSSSSSRCMLVPEQKRSVTGTHRSVLCYITERSCDYEVEITVVDTRNRRSPSSKAQVVRYHPASSLIIGKASEQWIQYILAGLLVGVTLVTIVISSVACLRSRKMSALQKDVTKVLRRSNIIGRADDMPQLKSAHPDLRWTGTVSSRQAIGLRGGYFDSDEESQRISGSLNTRGSRTTYHTTIPRPPIVDPPQVHYMSQTIRRPSPAPRTSSTNSSYLPRDERQGYSACLSNDNRDYDTISEYQRPHTPIISYLLEATPIIDVQELVQIQHLGCGTFGNCLLVSIRSQPKMTAMFKEARYNRAALVALKRELVAVQSLCSNTACPESVISFISVVATIIPALEQNEVVGLLYHHCEGGTLQLLLDHVHQSDRNVKVHGSVRTNEEMYHCTGSMQKKSFASFVIQCALNVANALNYVKQCGFVHRDVASRNVYLVKQWTEPFFQPSGQRALIGDFSLCEPLQLEPVDCLANDLCTSLLPPEAIDHGIYSEAGDVWQFGCFMLELCCNGRPPNLDVVQIEAREERIHKLVKKASSGNHEMDSLVSSKLRPLIQSCLNINPLLRPSIEEALLSLENLIPPPMLTQNTESIMI